MRWLTLYLRSRSVPAALAAVIAGTAALWWLGTTIDDPRIRDTLALLAALTGVAATAPGLAGADPDLDRTAAIAWPPRRAMHVILAGAIITGLATLTHAGPVLRDVTGLIGLLALGVATIGASRAVLLPVIWTVFALRFTAPLGTPPTGPGYQVMLTWMVQPGHTTPATVTAVLLGLAGTVTYSVRGPGSRW
ncbi:MAG TPA: hypothetical protein VGR06_07470 [Actinophytocola sp.]|uniref:hypothetical protein n=1 Tax=Actinophytocola sp. TaxID=1872138 RepID=UPI002DFDD6D7|nr:hypothetical protein [Actinophytocola sp.]